MKPVKGACSENERKSSEVYRRQVASDGAIPSVRATGHLGLESLLQRPARIELSNRHVAGRISVTPLTLREGYPADGGPRGRSRLHLPVGCPALAETTGHPPPHHVPSRCRRYRDRTTPPRTPGPGWVSPARTELRAWGRTAPPPHDRSDRAGHRTIQAGPGTRGREGTRPPTTDRPPGGPSPNGTRKREPSASNTVRDAPSTQQWVQNSLTHTG
jgi:hypothetical protein